MLSWCQDLWWEFSALGFEKEDCGINVGCEKEEGALAVGVEKEEGGLAVGDGEVVTGELEVDNF